MSGAFRSGFVSVVGRPNVGKSTLVNRLVGRKVAIVSPRPQTTRNLLLGIANLAEAQVVLMDTPGLHKPTSALGRQMMEEVDQALEGADLVAMLVDSSEQFGSGDRWALERVHDFSGPTFLVLNKIDLIPKPRLLPLIDTYRSEAEFAEIVPVSALTGDGLPLLIEKFIAYLPAGKPFFPPDQFTDQPGRFLAGEIIREKAIALTRDEVPHALAVLVEDFEETPGLIRIRANIEVERAGQKGILIGRGGEMLKRVGTAARRELEQLLDTKVFLELYVQVRRHWRNNPALVRRLDWRRQLELLGRK
ncbi:MAG TPA: GTPase Era [Candidatus Acidoferrales bacterium]|nr:GTPase Era [Candidatus Acidoferrales bacterium]